MPWRIETERLVLTSREEKDAQWLTKLLDARGAGRFTTEEALERTRLAGRPVSY